MVLTDDEMQGYIDMAERNQWDPDRWVPSPAPRRGRFVLVYDVNERQEATL